MFRARQQMEEGRSMARAPRQRGGAQRERGGAPKAAAAEAPKKDVSMARLWLEEHWHGWVKPVSGILLLGVAWLLYSYDIVSERIAGLGAVAAIVFGTIVLSMLGP